ncbi:hypothetical protein CY0110_30930 [Crocosphaera chwakensis CCY0110]|uniref:Uncharacterized protein n=1 Tax=Crocosphaera chwakensis CCY0110 TaxID=391612 RepID=A3IZR8_9CHRO|nr:hypothetical protein CY0110_30930 [Crocosphaera chwakensis CCY0110]
MAPTFVSIQLMSPVKGKFAEIYQQVGDWLVSIQLMSPVKGKNGCK